MEGAGSPIVEWTLKRPWNSRYLISLLTNYDYIQYQCTSHFFKCTKLVLPTAISSSMPGMPVLGILIALIKIFHSHD